MINKSFDTTYKFKQEIIKTKEYDNFIREISSLSKTNEIAKKCIDKFLELQNVIKPMLNTMDVNSVYAKQKGDFAKEQGNFAFEQALNLKKQFDKISDLINSKHHQIFEKPFLHCNMRENVVEFKPKFKRYYKNTNASGVCIKQGSLITVIGEAKWVFGEEASIISLPYWSGQRHLFSSFNDNFSGEVFSEGVKIFNLHSDVEMERVLKFKFCYVNLKF